MDTSLHTEADKKTDERTDWDRPIRIGEYNESNALFAPFDRQILCPECYHEFLLEIHPIHLKIPIDCPRCMHPLSELIHQHIAQHQRDKSASEFLHSVD